MPLKKNQRTIGSLSLSLLLVVTSLRLADVRAEEQEAHTGTLKNWEPYGSVRMEGAYWQRYKWYEHLDPLTAARINYDSLKSEGFIVSKGGMDSVLLDTLPVTQLRMGLQNNSYFGVRGKGDRFGFCFEMGLGAFLQDVGLLGTQQSDISELSLSSSKRQSTVLRKVYGDWYILKDRGKGIDYLTLRIGQDWNIANFFPSGQVFNSDAGLGYSGILYTGRKPQVKLSLGNKEHTSVPWNIQAAVIKQDLYTVPNYGTNGYLQKTEEELPKFEFGGQAGYKFSNLLNVNATVVGGVTQYSVVVYKEDEPTLAKDRRHAVKSNLFGVNLELGVWKTRTNLVYSTGQNMLTYGVWVGNPDASLADAQMRMFLPSYDNTADKVLNAKGWQGGLVFNVQPLSWLAWEIGGGMEAEAARWYKENSKKPVVGFIAGVTAPPGKRMGHAGALISGGADTADAKLAIMEACGFVVTRNPSELGKLLKAQLK